MMQQQICFGIMVFSVLVLTVSWLLDFAGNARPTKETDQTHAEIQPVKIEPPDETWWREIFDCYD